MRIGFLKFIKNYLEIKFFIDQNKYNEQYIDIIMSMLEIDPNKRPTCQEFSYNDEDTKICQNCYLMPLNFI